MPMETIVERIGTSLNSHEADRSAWRRVMGIGIVTTALGIFALAAPRATTLAIDVLVGLSLVVAAGMQVCHGFSWQRPGKAIWRIAAAATCGVLGILLLAFPRQGALTLTTLLAMTFIVTGALGMASALATRPMEGWHPLMLGAAIIAGLGVFIWTQLPNAAAWTIGLLIGMELLLSGRVIIISAMAMRQNDSAAVLHHELSL